jgi:UV DNA damage endonuclease
MGSLKMDIIRIGYACINTELRSYDVFTSRTAILSTIKIRGINYLRKLVEQNLDDLFKILIWNEGHGIRFFRLSSSMFPHLGSDKLSDCGNASGHNLKVSENASEYKLEVSESVNEHKLDEETLDYDIKFVKSKLQEIGTYAKTHGHRLTMHPGQFVQLGSPRQEVVDRSIIDLTNHAKILHYMGYEPSDGSVLVIHGGGSFGDKTATLERWAKVYKSLPKKVRQYICLENDEHVYGISDLLPFCEEQGIPFCLDVFHNAASRNPEPITPETISRYVATWTKRNLRPKLHVSEQRPDERRGAHSLTISSIPTYLFEIPFTYGIGLDIMLEVKDKDVSVLKIYNKYFNAKLDTQTLRISFDVKHEFTN